jgi:hypothetical protein
MQAIEMYRENNAKKEYPAASRVLGCKYHPASGPDYQITCLTKNGWIDSISNPTGCTDPNNAPVFMSKIPCHPRSTGNLGGVNIYYYARNTANTNYYIRFPLWNDSGNFKKYSPGNIFNFMLPSGAIITSATAPAL